MGDRYHVEKCTLLVVLYGPFRHRRQRGVPSYIYDLRNGTRVYDLARNGFLDTQKMDTGAVSHTDFRTYRRIHNNGDRLSISCSSTQFVAMDVRMLLDHSVNFRCHLTENIQTTRYCSYPCGTSFDLDLFVHIL